MKVTFVGVGSEQLGISLLSAVLKREGHTVDLAFNPALFDYDGFVDIAPVARLLDQSDRIVEQIVRDPPGLLAFSVLTPAYQWSLLIAREVKRRVDVPVIFGGVHPSAVPDVCLENSCVDYVCVGEGEEAMRRLCDELDRRPGQRPRSPIPNLSWRDGEQVVRGPRAGFLADLDSLPSFDKSIWSEEIRIADTWMTMSSRGCPYRCTFCFNNFFANLPDSGSRGYLRQRSIDHMMSELIDAKATWGIRRVDFEDDIFTVKKPWVRDFLREYRREIGLPFQCLVHPRYVDDEIARWLKDSGCEHVQMGIQSVDETYKRRQLLRMESDSHLRSALHALHTARLDVKADHILGLPGEPPSAQALARELYLEYTPRRIQTFWLVHLPGVELTTGAVERGELSNEEYGRIVRGASGKYHAPDASEHASWYRRHELMFRLLPIVPERVRRKVNLRYIPSLPTPTLHAFGIALELVNALKNRDKETINYARFYAHQLRRVIPPLITGESRRRRRRIEFGPRTRVTAPVPESALRPPAHATAVITSPPRSAADATTPASQSVMIRQSALAPVNPTNRRS